MRDSRFDIQSIRGVCADEAVDIGHSTSTGVDTNALMLETIKGDRGSDLSGLEGRKWDVVIDNSGYMARDVKASAELLAENVGYYIFISSARYMALFGPS